MSLLDERLQCLLMFGSILRRFYCFILRTFKSVIQGGSLVSYLWKRNKLHKTPTGCLVRVRWPRTPRFAIAPGESGR